MFNKRKTVKENSLFKNQNKPNNCPLKFFILAGQIPIRIKMSSLKSKQLRQTKKSNGPPRSGNSKIAASLFFALKLLNILEQDGNKRKKCTRLRYSKSTTYTGFTF